MLVYTNDAYQRQLGTRAQSDSKTATLILTSHLLTGYSFDHNYRSSLFSLETIGSLVFHLTANLGVQAEYRLCSGLNRRLLPVGIGGNSDAFRVGGSREAELAREFCRIEEVR
jgi:hypothetical protein